MWTYKGKFCNNANRQPNKKTYYLNLATSGYMLGACEGPT